MKQLLDTAPDRVDDHVDDRFTIISVPWIIKRYRHLEYKGRQWRVIRITESNHWNQTMLVLKSQYKDWLEAETMEVERIDMQGEGVMYVILPSGSKVGIGDLPRTFNRRGMTMLDRFSRKIHVNRSHCG